MKKLIFFLMLVAPFFSQAEKLKIKYPPILDFYPNCSYDIVKTYSAKSQTDDTSKKTKKTNDLLLKIRKEAEVVGADAVILIAKEIKRKITATKFKVAIFTIKYEAELVKLCNDESNDAKRLTAYDHLGNKTINLTSTSQKISNTLSHTFTFSDTIHRPKITINEVSLENGVYGVKLDDNYQNVIATLGTPSTIINVFTDEFIIGYGRRHWLHFQNNKLVKIQTTATLLSQSTVNKIPFLDFFDDFNWRINNKISYKTNFTDVNKTLQTTDKPNKKDQLILENNIDKLTLFFNNYKKQGEHDMQYTLNGFSLEKKAYQQLDNKVSIDRAKNFTVLKNIMDSLNEKQNIDFDVVKSQLGEALSSIKLSNKEQIIIYNNNLSLQIKNNNIKIKLLEDIFLTGVLDNTTSPPWYLGNFIQNHSVEQLRKYFPIDSFELDNQVVIDSDEYQISLFFDDNGDESLLYEAEVILY